ncbi:MAG: ribosomal protein S18-alanine N-acetyltransferase [Wenzhouxiangella sp.]|nr:ribosomal protein S18-alanine N-acetyltransferase [Wenzhouxiangella sp.]MCH8476672.1 ribosomal protein S18-alanine N-acetyltransferase [Wenzhouxiangella sp.]TVR96322.1 MAG: ribosomal-protein-alanine N-acetyltransferase [Wenzhouxiangellaceae bacterium]
MVAVLSPKIRIRAMQRSDLDAVCAIESDSYPFPWSRGIFSDCLRVGYRCLVLDRDFDVAGYAVASLALDEGHLLNLCIDSSHRRQGLAGLLLHQVMMDARVAGMARVFLEVRPSNPGAIALYQASGFRQIGRRPGYYPAYEGREDALVMVCHVEDYRS